MATIREEYFGEYKQCEYCHRPLPEAFEGTVCPACADRLLFQEVKQYIRENNVNEYQVADHFHIPVRRVKQWIRDGRIEYVTNGDNALTSVHCQRCGARVSFGTLCPRCLKLLNSNIRGYEAQEQEHASRMRFVDYDKDHQ